MKKPEIKCEYGDGFYTHDELIVDGEKMDVDDIAFVYSEMVEALIQSKSELLHLYNILEIDGGTTFNVKNIDKALKNAGVEL